ncbi:nucleotide exchange factor GrpE [Candidatus Kaiserbacteria bacterium]|nr:nucleotide exchange factor GrpE [Candidatus Kaiserbacteria bacterium]
MSDEERDLIDFEPEEELDDAAAAKAKVKKLRDELEKIKKERQEYLDGWQRCKADSVNLKREAEARARHLSEALREELVHDIIPSLDSFDMAAASDAWESVSLGWRSGMEHVRNQLIEALHRHGIERIGRVGEPIDHAIHDVLEERDDVAGEKQTVARVIRFGYKTKERILRPAQVIAKK